ncbi:Kanamycin nucleotidyltransferase [Actinobacillus pleuropneumoniae]|nr:Kanamycin nucleotidyltransferase [Actinobacillus pleuropneumoniae]
MKQKQDIFKAAASVDDSWAIKAGAYVHLQEIYDPGTCSPRFGKLPLQVSDEAIKETMREFMIWEPYETMGKIRNNVQSGNLNYLPLGAKDLTWQTAKLIGLANRTFYHTRARTLEESLSLPSRPSGYDELAQLVMRGQLLQIDHVYELCEQLWTGLNAWYEQMNIEYTLKELPF